MKIILKTTKHDTTSSEQFKKIEEECLELQDEYWFDNDEKCIQEAIDLAKATIKFAYTRASELGLNFDYELAKNDKKNEDRNYH